MARDAIELIDDALFAEVLEGAHASARRRLNHNFHLGAEDNPHRFLNVFLRGTYCAPHRHVDPPKSETFLCVRGHIGVLVFDDAGEVTGRHHLGEGHALGIDLLPGVWHTVVALSDEAVCFEVKPGPWDPATDKDFAPWAPREGDAEAKAYLERLEAQLA